MRYKKELSVLALTIGKETPSSRIRISNMRPYAHENSISFQFREIPKNFFQRINVLFYCRNFDVVIIQKKFFSLFWTNVLLIFTKKAKKVFDFDDAVWIKGPNNQERVFRQFIKKMDMVVVGNSFLYDFCILEMDNVHKIPSSIDIEAYREKDYSRQNEEIVIVWIGVSENFFYLDRIYPALEALRKQGFCFSLLVVSNRPYKSLGNTQEKIKINFTQWSLEAEVESLRCSDIGIMPLSDSEWSKGKCGFKLIQCMGVGLPVVASAVGANLEIIEHNKTGFLVESDKDWEKYLSILLKDGGRRRIMGIEGRATVRKSFSLESNAKKFFSLLKESIDKR